MLCFPYRDYDQISFFILGISSPLATRIFDIYSCILILLPALFYFHLISFLIPFPNLHFCPILFHMF